MPGCTLLTTGIPNPLPPSPIFLYMDNSGKPVPPPNYVPSLDDCYGSGCSCGCSGGSSGTSGGCGCSGSSSQMPGFAGGCGADAHAAQLEAVNEILQQASQELTEANAPGWLEVWDGGSGNFLRQFSVPTVDALGPTPVFTYNCTKAGDVESLFGAGWSMIFSPTLSSINSTTAAFTKGTGASFTYTNKNITTGVYSAPAGALNKLVQNAGGSWTETQPDGLTLNYNTSGQLASIKRGTNTWTLTYGTAMFGQPYSNHITDPANRRATFLYSYTGIGVPPYNLRRFTDVVGRVTTFSYNFVGSEGVLLRSIQTPDQALTTLTYNAASHEMSVWQDPLGHRTSYTYNNGRLASVSDPTGNVTQFGYLMGQTPGQTYIDPRSFVTTYSYNASNQPTGVLNPLGQSSTLVWTGGEVTTAVNTAGNRTTLSYATMSDGRKFVSGLQTPQGARYTWLYDTSDRVRATVDPLGNRNSFSWDSNNNRTAQVDAPGNRTSFLYTSGGQLRAVINPLGQRTTALFDSASRVKALVDPLGNRTTFAYTALSQPGPITSPTNCLTTTLYDSLNRIRAVIDPYNNRTTRTYDSASRLRMVIDPLNHILTTLYDSDGRTRATIDQLARRTTLTYDAAGNLKAVQNPLGFIHTTLFDSLNRPRAKLDALGNRTTLGYL